MKGPDCLIQRVNDENFDEFLRLVEYLAEYEKLDPPDDGARRRLKADGLSPSPKYEAYLEVLDGKPVGYLIFFFTYSSFLARPTLYIEDIFVLREHRRKGIGRDLFDFCVDRAREENCGRVEWCVLDWNKTAIAFYEKNGATSLGWTFFRLERDQIEHHPDRAS